MTGEQIFNAWTPPASHWAAWAKAVLFAQIPDEQHSFSTDNPSTIPPQAWFRDLTPATAVVVDLPGLLSVAYGVALARHGHQPVPLFNCGCGSFVNELLPTHALRTALHDSAAELQTIPLPENAPPAFLLDSDRLNGRGIPRPGKFDNRWMVFPQDFPSARFLKESGIDAAMVIQSRTAGPQSDLQEVLLRWQEGGMRILRKGLDNELDPLPISIHSPSQLRYFFERALVLTGFRRNSAGGFGSIIPELNRSSGLG